MLFCALRIQAVITKEDMTEAGIHGDPFSERELGAADTSLSLRGTTSSDTLNAARFRQQYRRIPLHRPSAVERL
jgi:hypothetical protein